MSRKCARCSALAVAAALLVAAGGTARAQESMTVAFDTSATSSPQFDPKNILAVWIEDGAGNFVKTIAWWSENTSHRRYLHAWLARSGGTNNDPDPDGFSGATFQNYQTGLVVNWDLKDRSGSVVSDGTYTIRMELADANSDNAAANNQGTFTFQKNGASSTQSGASGGFNNVTIDYVAPNAEDCGNGALDTGESCDDSVAGEECPDSCGDSGDACMPLVVSGSATACTAVCEAQPVTECVSDDGCCPGQACADTDSDCWTMGEDPTSTDDRRRVPASGGCSAIGSDGSGAAWLPLLLLGLAFVGSSRTRRPRHV